MTRRRFAALAWFPGAVRAVAPVARALLERRWEGLLAVGPSGGDVARRAGLDAESLILLPSAAPGQGAEFLERVAPSVAIAGVSEGNSPEKHMVATARRLGMPSCIVLDTPSNCQSRMTDGFPGDPLPTVLAVMNDLARREIESEGFFQGRIAVTGHPGLDEFLDRPRDAGSCSRARSELGLPRDRRVVVYMSQPIEQQFGKRLGYTQHDALAILARELGETGETLLVAVHPRDDRTRLARIAPRAHLVSGDYDPAELYDAADVVVSCFSAALTESIAAGVPAVSLQPGLAGPDPCWTNGLGASLLATSPEELRSALAQARGVAASPSETALKRTLLGIPNGGTARVVELVEGLAVHSS